jgi:hypothetical protein
MCFDDLFLISSILLIEITAVKISENCHEHKKRKDSNLPHTLRANKSNK